MSVNPQAADDDVPMPSPTRVPDRPSVPAGAAFRSLDEVGEALMSQRYVADSSLAMSIFLACGLPRPLLVEGEAGVGKTEIAKVLSAALGTRLIRLQCYEGIDVRQAVYEWNYSKQMLRIRSLEQHETLGESAFESIFSPEYLIHRPLLQAIEAAQTSAPVQSRVSAIPGTFWRSMRRRSCTTAHTCHASRSGTPGSLTMTMRASLWMLG